MSSKYLNMTYTVSIILASHCEEFYDKAISTDRDRHVRAPSDGARTRDDRVHKS